MKEKTFWRIVLVAIVLVGGFLGWKLRAAWKASVAEGFAQEKAAKDLQAFGGILGGTVQIAPEVYVTSTADGSVSVLVKNVTLSDGHYECAGSTECSLKGYYGVPTTFNVDYYVSGAPVSNVAINPEALVITYLSGGRCYMNNTQGGDIHIVCPGASAQAAIDAIHPSPPPPPPEPPADPPAATP